MLAIDISYTITCTLFFTTSSAQRNKKAVKHTTATITSDTDHKQETKYQLMNKWEELTLHHCFLSLQFRPETQTQVSRTRESQQGNTWTQLNCEQPHSLKEQLNTLFREESDRFKTTTHQFRLKHTWRRKKATQREKYKETTEATSTPWETRV